VVFLIPSFYPYWVPIFDELYQRLEGRFVVVAMRHHGQENARVAVQMGRFPRRLVGARAIPLPWSHDQGKKPLFGRFGRFWAPSLPLVLISLRPQVVISVAFTLWTLTSIAMGYPTVIEWEGFWHTERAATPWRTSLRRWMAKRAGAFVVNGALSRQYLVGALRVPNDRILEPGICAEPRPDWVQTLKTSLPGGGPVRFLFVGQMIERKGVAHLLHAAKLLETRWKTKFELVMVGDGPKRERYWQLAHELGLGDRVHFVKNVLPSQVWEYYETAHVLVLPTLLDHWAMVVPEAMSVGLPVLVSKYAGSVPELICHGENGYVFDPEDHEGLAGCMERYLSNPELITQHGLRSLRLISSYTPERVAQIFLQAVERARDSR